MQELKLNVDESDSASLVLHSEESGAEFFLPVTDKLRSLISDANAPTLTTSEDTSEGDNDEQGSTLSAVSFGESATDSEPAQEDTPDVSEQPSVAQVGVEKQEKKRRYRSRINMTPRTIQDRVRHGATVAELAQEADTDESRIEPYAWPIIQERARIAELAHAAHPVSGEGPSKQTLWEVLATALAARGANLSDATWDAHQDTSRRWIITVSWDKEAAGQTSSHEAQFMFEQSMTGPSLAHPVNSLSGDLVDPRYGQPVRRIAAVTPLLDSPAEGAEQGAEDYSEYNQYDDHGNNVNAHPAAPERQEEPAEDQDFLVHPESNSRKSKRKRKAVTPHWEDVLLGVRTNPRKKK